MNVLSEITFTTTRSGGKGGQNVNKVETAVLGYFAVHDSKLLNEDQKNMILAKLANRINAEGVLIVKSQEHRSQLANKEEVIRKIHDLLEKALHTKKLRIATKMSKAAKERRIQSKKRRSETKSGRQKWKGE